MSLTMPEELQTAVRMLGLAPDLVLAIFDVDEDKLVDIAGSVKDGFGVVGDSLDLIESIFRELGDNLTDTESLAAIADSVSDINAYMKPIMDGVGDGIDITMPALHAAIVELKLGALAIIAANAGPLIAAIMSGVGIPLALVGKAAVKITIDNLVAARKEEFVHFLVSELTFLFDKAMETDAKQEELAQRVVDFAQAIIAVDVAESGFKGSGTLAKYNNHDITEQVNKLAFSIHGFNSGWDEWHQQADEAADVGKHRGPGSVWVTVINDVLKWLLGKLKSFGKTVMRMTIDALVELLEGAASTLVDIGEKNRAKLEAMRAELEVILSRMGPMQPIDTPPPATALALILADSRAMGSGHVDADDPDKLRLPVIDSKPIGTVRDRVSVDLSALDLPVTHSRPIGTADSDASSAVGPMDVDVKQL